MSKSWDSGILKKLKALTGKGLSTSEIGKRLGISKNAVVGKLHRLGWNSKAVEAPAKKTTTKTKTSSKVAKPTKTKVGAKAKLVAKPVSKTVKTGKKVAVPAKKAVKKEVVKKSTAKPTSVAKSVKTVTKTVKSSKTTKSAEKAVEKTVKETKIEAPKKTSSGTAKKSLSVHQRMIQHSLEMMELKPGQCRWPIGDPDSENFHFCGRQVFTGKPYCYEHCKQAYQFTAPKKK